VAEFHFKDLVAKAAMLVSACATAELFSEVQHCIVTANKDIMENRLGALRDLAVEQAGVGRGFTNPGGKIFVGGADNLHACRLEEL
jgi:hypothetical protein